MHNFPEGIATFLSAINDKKFAVSTCIAIAMHNIPEGFTISAPIYYATNCKVKAFVYSLLTGLTEPLGAIVAYFFLGPYINEYIFGMVYGIIGGIMAFVSFD